jgi:hypothetical protein
MKLLTSEEAKFGNDRAFVIPMKTNNEDEDWERLCTLIANEADPQRLISLVDQLLMQCDARRERLGQRKPPDQK